MRNKLTTVEKWARQTLKDKNLKFKVVFNSSMITTFLCFGKNQPPRVATLYKDTNELKGGMTWASYKSIYNDPKTYTKELLDGVKKAEKWLKDNYGK
ncbi:MAG TPA: hypothetical protein PLP33_24520 [Leptospiraceae bacterium]|nr:hypothetical protein [Leptospiraceae bacterium]